MTDLVTTISDERLAEMIIAAYRRGHAWCLENPGSEEYLAKAAYDYANKALSSLEASPAPVSEEKMWRSGTAMKGTDPSLIHPDNKGHRTRFSDASTFDEICVLCGATDGRGDKRLYKPCPNTLVAKGGQCDA